MIVWHQRVDSKSAELFGSGRAWRPSPRPWMVGGVQIYVNSTFITANLVAQSEICLRSNPSAGYMAWVSNPHLLASDKHLAIRTKNHHSHTTGLALLWLDISIQSTRLPMIPIPAIVQSLSFCASLAQSISCGSTSVA